MGGWNSWLYEDYEEENGASRGSFSRDFGGGEVHLHQTINVNAQPSNNWHTDMMRAFHLASISTSLRLIR